MKKVMTIFGTRPEMIKMWSVLNALDNSNYEHIMVHTGQNYTPELKDFFFRDLCLRSPNYYMNIDVTTYGKEVADIIRKSDDLFEQEKPDALIILGDTYSGLSVLPAKNRGIKIFHMEAGLRAWDKRMPEQTNRRLIDHISDILLPFNAYHRENLIREDIHPSKIIISGNPTFEVMRAFEDQIENSNILSTLKLSSKNYILVTAHRKENVDNPLIFKKILIALDLLSKKIGVNIIYPMHPRTMSKLTNYQISDNIQVMKPLGFYDFNKLSKNALCLVSDSGTSSEEGLFYKVPCVSVRQTTERYETIEAGAHIIAGIESQDILDAVVAILNQKWFARYDFNDNFSPSNVIMNSLQSSITNYF
jgi:UDP-N-acetylglucosamine 2-epimerase (non-hydrolysing)